MPRLSFRGRPFFRYNPNVSSKTKSRTVYVCQACGGQTPRWMGKCPDCEAWNTLVETLESPAPAVARAVGTASRLGLAHARRRSRSAPCRPSGRPALQVPIGEFNRVLGGGIVPGSVVLLGGDPGIGKSTLLLIVSSLLSQQGPVLYVSGEESPEQLKMRADRLGLDGRPACSSWPRRRSSRSSTTSPR